MKRILVTLFIASVCLTAPWGWPVVRVKAAAAVVQATSSAIVSIGSGGTSHSFSGNVTSGNAVIVVIVTGAGVAPDLSASDATNGAYTQASENPNADISSGAHYKCNLTGGFTAVTAVSSTTGNGMIALFEVSGLGPTLVAIQILRPLHMCHTEPVCHSQGSRPAGLK
jgi:hypothetical protein